MDKKFDKKSQKPRANNQIRVPEVQVIDETGQALGVMNTEKALKLAQEKELDLVEVGALVRPPIVKIMDFGKYMYLKDKGSRKNKKPTSHAQELKTLRIGLRTETHDMLVRAGQVDKFIKKGFRVLVQLTLRGREREMAQMGKEKLIKFLDLLSEEVIRDGEPRRYPRGFEIIVRSAK